MYKIDHPEQTTYYIFTQTGEDWVHYGQVDPINCLGSGLDTEETFLSEEAYLERLAEFGIFPIQEEPSQS